MAKLKDISKQINKMVALDLEMRKKADKGKVFDLKLDKENTIKLKSIIQEIGWPTISLVGKKASWGAWLLVQHADHDVKFQKKCLSLMKRVYLNNKKNILPANIAFLEDRILISERKKQKFGSQFKVDKRGNLSLAPLNNPKNVDKLRKEWGLPPLQDYLDSAKQYKPKRA
ncbi:MAG: hypothetical protein HYV76_01825 [Candidatus Vogelbacteria bacterium]|nr:hypothetical protein [Candidatus Vogelbacteria bacterium]